MSRVYCSVCEYPVKTCICDAIECTVLPVSIVIIQHPNEAKHAKNTLKLAKLVSPSIDIVLATDQSKLKHLFSQTLVNTVLVYPNPRSKSIENFAKQIEIGIKNKPNRLIYIDSTWKQAYGIWKTNQYLHELDSVHFSELIKSQYQIRRSKKEFQLSSIEAIAYGLQVLFDIKSEPYLHALQAMQSHWPKR